MQQSSNIISSKNRKWYNLNISQPIWKRFGMGALTHQILSRSIESQVLRLYPFHQTRETWKCHANEAWKMNILKCHGRNKGRTILIFLNVVDQCICHLSHYIHFFLRPTIFNHEWRKVNPNGPKWQARQFPHQHFVLSNLKKYLLSKLKCQTLFFHDKYKNRSHHRK